MNFDFFPGGLNLPTKQDCILDYAQTAGRRQYTRLIQEHLAQTYDAPPLALVHSFGCQQNAADGEKLRGMLGEMGYGFTDSLEEADFILYNTCAVRENAEKRVFGTVGALKHYKRQKPELLIALVGCMTQQQSVAERLKKSYPHVDIVAGADAWASLPERIYGALCLGRRSIKTAGEEPDTIVENLPARRTGWAKAWAATTSAPTALSPMSGGGSAAAVRRISSGRWRAWWGRGTRTSPCWARTSTPTTGASASRSCCKG